MGNIKLQGFLQIPNLVDIKKKPGDPYKFPTGGRVHADKFMLIYNELTQKDSPSKEDILEKFDGHSLHSTITQLTINDLSDFCRHVIIANKSSIGWENVDDLLLLIDKKYTPYWRMPNFNFQSGFTELFRQLVNWEIPESVDFIKEKIINEREKKIFQGISEKFSSKIQVWNFMDLWSLYKFLINIQNTNVELKENIKINQIRNKLTTLFLDQLKDKKYPVSQRIALGLLFTKSFVEIGSEQVIKAEEILDKIWREVELLDDIEILSLTYIFGAGYSTIASHVFKSSSDFITRRRLLGRLIANFINAPNLHLKDWLQLLQKQNMDPVIFTFIIEGYSNLADILFEHYLEFPQGTAKNELYELVEFLSLNILDTMNFYLSNRFNLDFKSEKNIQKYFKNLMQIKELKNCRDDLLLTIFSSIKYYLKLDNQLTDDKAKYIELGKLIAKELYSEEVAIVFDLDFSLFYKTYQFQSILIEIENEILHSSSIILSTTFETQIIQKISQMMDYFMNNSTKTDKIDLESYEIILYFTSEWLQYFQLSKPLYSEALMVVAPIISICFVQIARSYFENNQVQKAFLTYLNMHYFVELFIDEIKRSATWQSGSGQGAKDRDDISNRFNQLIKDWNFQELLNIKNIKEIVIDIELSLNKISSHSSGSSALSGMLEDDLIFGYIDLTKQLEDFIESDINPNIEKSVFDQIHSYDLYKRPEVNSNYRNNRMGQVLGVSEFKELPFPIIRNVHEIAIALHMFPLELSLHPFSKDSKLYQSFTNIFDSGKSDTD